MRKIYLVLALLCLGFAGFAQTAASYNFTATNGTFTTISGTGTGTTRISYDDSTLTNIPIGFTFNYCGTNYTRLSACSNGWLSFANASSATSFTTWAASFSNSTSSLSSLGSGVGFLMPFWDDLWGSGHTAYYQTSGTAPYRTFTFEWTNWGLFLDYTHYANFQVILYETTNQIDFVYGTSSYPSRTATIGLANSSSDFNSLDNSSSAPTPSTSTFTTSISTLAANGQIYRWNPPPAGCSGTPSAGTASATPATACGSSTINLSLIGYTLLSGVTYQWQKSGDGVSWSSISGATNLYLSTTESTDQYYRCNVRCTASSTTSSSGYVFVPHTSGCYCTPTYSRAYASCDSLGISITRFSVNGTAGTSINDVAHCTGTGYFDRTALSVSLFDGATYTATINGSASYSMNAQVWIDFNDDFTFQSSETVGGNNNYFATSTFALAIPSGSALGAHRMRIVTVDNATGPTYSSLNPCAGYSLGDARDYNVIIYPVCTGTPAGGIAHTSASPVCTAPFTLSLTAYTIAGAIAFQWQSSPNDTTWTDISGATNATLTTTEVATTYYRCNITCTTVGFTTPSSSTLVNYLSSCYCTPSYTAAAAACGAGVVIGSLQIAGAASTLLNDVASCTGSGYQDRTALAVSLLQGSSATAYITGGTVSQNSQTWIDFNDDGTFASSESVGGLNAYTTSASYTISISSGSALGTHRMRVVTSRAIDGFTYSSMNPCTPGYVRGEARDYTVNILSNSCTGMPSAGSLSVSVASSCSAFTPTLTAVGYTSAPFIHYKWETSTDSTIWTAVSGPTGATYSPTVSSGVVYYRFVDSCGPSSSAARTPGVRLVVNTLPAVTAISGADSVCEGTTSLFANTTTGGTWSLSNTTSATISSGGLVTGLVAGVDTVNYAVTNGCGTTTISKRIIISPAASAGILSGLFAVCEGSTITLSSSATGGVWTASNTNASVTGGTVTGVTAGADTIYYTVTNSCGTASANRTVTVNALPRAGAISGPSAVCEGSFITLSDTTLGGTWSASNGNASVVGGIVTGLAVGVDTIHYSVSNSCGTDVASKLVTINPLPHAGVITGPFSVCESATITLTDTSSGGTWSAANTHASVAGGVVTGVSSGIDTIYYTVTNSCGTDVAMQVVTINAAPHAGTITGPSAVCVTATASLSSSVIGGTWSATNASATVIGGTVSGLSAGIDTILYSYTNSCGTDITSHIVSVNPLPDAGVLSGSISVCAGASTTLSASVSGGRWRVSNSRASVVAGVVTGITAGVDTVIYTDSNSCGIDTALYPITVNPAPNAGTISGPSSVCEASNITLSSSVTGGTWTASNGNAMLIGAIVTGVTAGLDTISYSVTNGCGTATVTRVVTINPLPNPGTVSGTTSSVCVGSSISFSTTGTTGGTWHASTSHVSVTSAGIVTGVTNGTTILSYTVTNGCGTRSDTVLLTVNPNPYAGTLTGATSVCQAASTTLASSVTGGTWSASNGNATVTAGVVAGVTPGVDTIYYSITNVCGTSTASRVMTINPLPSASPITSATTSICVGGSTTYSNAVSGGTWSTGSTTIANVSSSGLVTGVGAGTTFISYSVTSTCGTGTSSLAITVNPVPSGGTITGPSSVCLGSVVSLSHPTGTAGGTWYSTNTAVATIDGTGNVFGNSVGTATISYIITTATCGSAFAVASMVVNPVPYAGTISGPTSVCRGSTVTLTHVGGTSGGSWSSSASGTAAVGATTGIVNGVAAGTATITYSASTVSCGTATATYAFTVNALPVAGTITGSTTFCEGSTNTFTNPTGTAGGNWTSASPTIASINSSGVATGVAPGTAIISYTAVTASCGTATTSITATINPLPHAGTITGVTSMCPSTTTVLSSSVSGGTWTSTNIHTTHTGGSVFALTPGVDSVGYVVTNGCGSSVTRVGVTVYPVPVGGTIAGPTSVCAGSSVTLTDTSAGGLWSTSSGIATISPSTGVITGVSAGTLITTYTVANFCGSAFTTRSFTVNSIVTPSVTMSINPGTNVCVGELVTFTAVPVSGGSGPLFTWRNAGAYLGSGSSFTYSPATGDAISCEMVSNASCISTTTVVSPTSVMTVNPVVNPSITILGTPGDTVVAGHNVTFIANVVNGGTAPTFQWYVNSGMIAGATNSTYTQPFYRSETVYCELTSSAQCVTAATVMSNLLAVYVIGLAVPDVTNSVTGLSLYPNPSNGSFTITGQTNDAVTFEVLDMPGRVVYTGTATPQQGVIRHNVSLGSDLAPGQYIVKVLTRGGSQFLHLIKE